MARWLVPLHVIALACAPADLGPTLPPGDQRIEMRPGGSARVDGTGVTLAFVRVTEDSRCPSGAACIWEGDAVVELRVESGGTAEVLHLHTSAAFARQAGAMGVNVRLEDLAPRPGADAPVPPGDYIATLSAGVR